MNERGSATVWTVLGMATLLVLVGVVVQLGAAVGARHRAEAAADLAALAAASHVLEGEAAACGRAAVVTDGMDVSLASCRLDGWDAVVEVDAAGPASLGSAHGRARAGPVQGE
ncbi:Rv3654c family TadE-like protein [Rhodococcus sp. X156]|uniref:Rv3654c family TadE-like protein n=1 Tax=Rhodococcus sp. X156 TaxID=2499145 RepID=UPI000FDAF903|nr:Rv3654c family TadE-like protein [Rhodococcus sp. X156]